MQIHELNTFRGAPGDTDFLAIDTGFDTSKISAPQLLIGKLNKPASDGEAGQILRNNGDGSTEWSDYGLPTDAQTEEAINKWLDAHPEATTTVQDGSLTEAKFSDDLKLKTIKDYVTPEMFGAVGDGETDDTAALTQMLNTGLPCVFPEPKKYYITNTLTIKNSFDGGGSEFICDISATSIKSALELHFDHTDYSITQAVSVGDTRINAGQIANLKVGDIILISSDENLFSSGTQKAGILREVKEVNGSLVTFDEPSPIAFTANVVKHYHTYFDGFIKNCKIKIVNSMAYIIALRGLMCKSTTIERVSVVSSDGLRGIFLQGINNVIDRCYAYGFTDKAKVEDRTGYGFNLDGVHNKIINSVSINSKHCIACGGSIFISEDITYRNNYAENGYSDDLSGELYQAVIDMHPSTFGGLVEGNTIVKSVSVNNKSIQSVSGCNIIVANNHYITDPSKLLQIYTGLNSHDIKFIGNKAEAVQIIKGSTYYAGDDHIQLIGNTGIGLKSTKALSDILVCGNNKVPIIMCPIASNRIYITDNQIVNFDFDGNSIHSIQLGDSSNICDSCIVKDNHIYSGYTGSSNACRINLTNSIYGNNILTKRTGGLITKYGDDTTNIVLDNISIQ